MGLKERGGGRRLVRHPALQRLYDSGGPHAHANVHKVKEFIFLFFFSPRSRKASLAPEYVCVQRGVARCIVHGHGAAPVS